MKSSIHILFILSLGLLISCSQNENTLLQSKGYFIFKVDAVSVSGGRVNKDVRSFENFGSLLK
ncbi:MAG: hypothetical protein ABJO91_20300 [Ekhidna sp.]